MGVRVLVLLVPVCMGLFTDSLCQGEERKETMTFGPRVIDLPQHIKGKPFAARFEEKHSSTGLGTSPSFQQLLEGVVYRDAAGRLRHEFIVEVAPGTTQSVALIRDPITETMYSLDIRSKTVTRVPFSILAETDAVPMAGPPVPMEHIQDDLGQRQTEGLLCHGYVIKDPRGFVAEVWISDELNEIVLERKTSQAEESVFRLFQIRRGEPESTLFEVPNDFTEAGDDTPN
jgi:hypothetical protein